MVGSAKAYSARSKAETKVKWDLGKDVGYRLLNYHVVRLVDESRPESNHERNQPHGGLGQRGTEGQGRRGKSHCWPAAAAGRGTLPGVLPVSGHVACPPSVGSDHLRLRTDWSVD